MPNALLHYLFTDSEDADTASENEAVDVPRFGTTGSTCASRMAVAPSILYYDCNVNSASEVSLSRLEVAALEEATREQSACQIWTEQRIGRVTASIFGKVFKCKTGQEGLVTDIMGYTKVPDNISSLKWGKENENKAIFAFTNTEGRKHVDLCVSKCGIFVCGDKPFLGASPDGLVDCQCCEPAVLEIKCPFASKNLRISEASQKKNFFLDENLALKKKHDYYFQIQGQMAITARNKCYFVVYTTVDIHVEIVIFDSSFWQSTVKKLESFFLNSVLTEIKESSIKKKIISCRESCVCKGGKSGCLITCSDCSKCFHIQCMKLKRSPKTWSCENCSV